MSDAHAKMEWFVANTDANVRWSHLTLMVRLSKNTIDFKGKG